MAFTRVIHNSILIAVYSYPSIIYTVLNCVVIYQLSIRNYDLACLTMLSYFALSFLMTTEIKLPSHTMDLLPDTQNCGLHMRRECRERFPLHRLQRKRLITYPGMHHGTCFTHVPWCMSGSLTHGGGENVPGIPGAFTTRNFAYLVRGPLRTILTPINPNFYKL